MHADALSALTSQIALRAYQIHGVEQLRSCFAAGNRRVLFCLPTGAGKTIVFAHIVASAVARGRRVAVLVHRRELVRQASGKLTLAGVRHGIAAAGLDRDHDAAVLVMSVQTAARRLDRLPQFDFVVLDECHHAVAGTWSRLLARWPGTHVLGVTATPARTDGKGLSVHAGGIFDSLVAGASVRELQAEGFLARTRCFVPDSHISTSGLRTRLGDWEAEALAERAGVVTGDAVAEYRKHADHLPAIAYGCTVAHAESIAAAFRAAGYRSECVHDGTPGTERDALIAGLADGSVEVLTSCDLISEGLDVPNVGAVILLRPTQSLVLAMQQVGRGMRPAPGKRHLVVLDFAGNALRHGMPETAREWSLAGVPKKAPRAAEAPCCWRCKECGCVNQLEDRVCPECGAVRPLPRRHAPLVVAGRLAEIGADHFDRIARLPYRAFVRRPRSRAELQAYAREHGYRAGWVWHRLREQQERGA
jgi:superfamily II DNA or RNA helicase